MLGPDGASLKGYMDKIQRFSGKMKSCVRVISFRTQISFVVRSTQKVRQILYGIWSTKVLSILSTNINMGGLLLISGHLSNFPLNK
jgi:hypothetical protein